MRAKRSARIRFELLEAVRILTASGHAEIVERHGIEVVVGQRDEAEPHAAQLDDLFEHCLDAALARLLAVGAPDRAERAVLGTPPHRLDGSPGIAFPGQQIPARLRERRRADPAGLVDPLRGAGRAIRQHPAPNYVAVAPDDGVGSALSVRLLRVQRRVNAAIDHPRAACARLPAERIPDQGVAGVHADPDDVARLQPGGIEPFQRLVDRDRIAELRRRRPGQHVPASGG